MARDRLDADILPLKHEFLSMMLGSRRAGITVALGAFREAGIIRTMYREIEILDREALEAASCECYSAVKQHHAPS
jgi:CRP-like cAMP-binding protein